MREKYEALSEEYLLQKNVINLFGPIDDATAYRIISQLQYLEERFCENGVPPEKRLITMQINSVGGVVSDGLAIYDTMNYIESRISTVCVGLAASMGAFLLSAGTRGLRKALPHSEILIHQPLGGAQGQASDIVIAAKHIERTKTTLNSILAENTRQTYEKIAADTDRDYCMTAEEALKYGIIDEIIKTENKAKGA